MKLITRRNGAMELWSSVGEPLCARHGGAGAPAGLRPDADTLFIRIRGTGVCKQHASRPTPSDSAVPWPGLHPLAIG
jgi:hypothetical protein